MEYDNDAQRCPGRRCVELHRDAMKALSKKSRSKLSSEWVKVELRTGQS